jgi:hypothetical protein
MLRPPKLTIHYFSWSQLCQAGLSQLALARVGFKPMIFVCRLEQALVITKEKLGRTYVNISYIMIRSG